MGPLEAFLLGSIGGSLAEFMAVNRHRMEHPKDWPEYFRLKSYWAFAVAWILLGGVFALLYNGDEGVTLSQILALNIGATAPLVAEQLVRTAPKIAPGSAG